MLKFYRLTMLLSFLLTLSLSAQVPNAGFEDWTNGNPDNWVTNNEFTTSTIPITQSNNARSGASALRGDVIAFQTLGYAPLMISGSLPNLGFSVSERHENVGGYFLLDSPGGDNLEIVVSMGVINGSDTTFIGAGGFQTNTSQSTYTPFVAPIIYNDAATPDICIIQVFLGIPFQATIGANFHLDDLAFDVSFTTSIDDEQDILAGEFELLQNYPNPFNPSTSISFNLPKASNVELVIYNQLGQAVSTVVNTRLNAGAHSYEWNAGDLPSGVYFYRLNAEGFSATKKMVLIR